MGHELTLDDVLRDKGVEDASEYLSTFDDEAPVGPMSTPHVQMRGSIHLMLGRTLTRRQVNERMQALRIL